MTKMKYFCVDTETVGGAACPDGTYNISGSIFDKSGEVSSAVNLIIEEHFDKIVDNAKYGKKNFDEYQSQIKEGRITCVPTEQMAVDLIRAMLRKNGVKYILAHNANFDLSKTMLAQLRDEFEFIDIQTAATQTIGRYKKYGKWCKENGFLTEKGRPRATAEAFFAFISDNPDFEEAHRAWEDSDIERQIFLAVLSTHRKFTRNRFWNEDNHFIMTPIYKG